jgi:hypothetical protein
MKRLSNISASMLIVLCLVASLSACCSIIHGTTQDIGISSSPSNAAVKIDNTTHGQTPMVAKLDRKKDHTLTIELAGFQPYSATITKSVSGWVWGNILFGGLIGLAVDAISGGLYVLTPEQVQATLMAQDHGDKKVERTDDSLFLAVVLHPESDWRRIGYLSR